VSILSSKSRVIIIDVRSNTGAITRFGLVAYLAQKQCELRLPLSFYSKGVDFPHFETEIIEPFVAQGQTAKLNYHFDCEGKKAYVCYPSTIPDEVKLRSVLSIWAVGQVCILSFDKYLNEMLAEAHGLDNFLSWAEKQGVTLISFSMA